MNRLRAAVRVSLVLIPLQHSTLYFPQPHLSIPSEHSSEDCPGTMGSNGTAGNDVLPSSPDAGPSQSPRLASPDRSPRSSVDERTPAERIAQLEDDLATTRQEKEVLGNQYRTLLGKLTAMRASLGEKLREDAVCLCSCSFIPMNSTLGSPMLTSSGRTRSP